MHSAMPNEGAAAPLALFERGGAEGAEGAGSALLNYINSFKKINQNKAQIILEWTFGSTERYHQRHRKPHEAAGAETAERAPQVQWPSHWDIVLGKFCVTTPLKNSENKGSTILA